MADLTFIQPFFLILIPLPLIWLSWRIKRPKQWPQIRPALGIYYPLLNSLDNKRDAQKVISVSGSDWLVAISVFFAVIALSQPATVGSALSKASKTTATDVVFVVGTAVSMTLKDYTVEGKIIDRMTMSKQLLDKFISRYPSQRMSLVVMGEQATLWQPWTSDAEIIRNAISRIQTTLGGRLTNMAAALKVVAESAGHDNNPYIVIMLTDGGLQIGKESPESGASAIARSNGHLYTIAIGAGNQDSFKQEASSLLYDPVDLPLLKTVSKVGNGEVFHATNQQAIIAALDTLQKRHQQTVVNTNQYNLMDPHYPLLLALSCVFFILALLQQMTTFKIGQHRGH